MSGNLDRIKVCTRVCAHTVGGDQRGGREVQTDPHVPGV